MQEYFILINNINQIHLAERMKLKSKRHPSKGKTLAFIQQHSIVVKTYNIYCLVEQTNLKLKSYINNSTH